MKLFYREKKSKTINIYSGQTVLVVILVMVVALTIGLSIAGRSTTDIRMSSQIEESQRAFSAAEAGIESFLYSGQEGVGSFGNASYNVRMIEGDVGEFLFPTQLTSSDYGYIWLVNHEDLETEVYNKKKIKVIWGNQNQNWLNDENTPALQVIIVYKDGELSKFGKFALDPRVDRGNNFCLPDGSNCKGVSNFKTTGETISGENLQFSADLDLSNFQGEGKILQLLVGKLYYNRNKHFFGAKALDGGLFPSQGKIIESTGVAGQTTRKVQVFQLNPILPAIFSYSIFSDTSIEK